MTGEEVRKALNVRLRPGPVYIVKLIAHDAQWIEHVKRRLHVSLQIRRRQVNNARCSNIPSSRLGRLHAI